MSYKFEVHEPLDQAFGRISREQLDHAIEELTRGIKREPVEAVHAARKAIKKERSLLRLYRAALPTDERRRANEELRSAARSLSATRDADVMVATIAQLSERFAGQLPATAFDALGGEFAAPTRQTSGRVTSASSRAIDRLRGVRSRMGSSVPSDDGWKAVGQGLTRSYRRGRKAFALAQTSRSDEDLHAWRKRVKDLWYHERVLAPVAGPTVKGHAVDAHRLADLLGDDHDLGLLLQRLSDPALAAPIDLDAVHTLINHRRDELQTEAMHVGRRVYAESPNAFRRRMRRALHAGQASAAAPHRRRPAELAAAIRAPGHSP